METNKSGRNQMWQKISFIVLSLYECLWNMKWLLTLAQTKKKIVLTSVLSSLVLLWEHLFTDFPVKSSLLVSSSPSLGYYGFDHLWM
jgi:hypothetical protein